MKTTIYHEIKLQQLRLITNWALQKNSETEHITTEAI
jgi:hypothetical protein